MFRRIMVLCIAAGAVGLWECGGDNSGPAGTRSTPVQYSITWAQRSRATSAPASALSAVLTIRGARFDGLNIVNVVDRVPDPAAYTNTYASLEPAVPGTYTAILQFFSRPAGAGSLLASAEKQVTINSDGSGVGDFADTATSVNSVSMLPNQTVFLGQSADLQFSVLDSSGTALAIGPGAATLTVLSGADKLTLSPSAQATGVATGTATVTANVEGHVSAPQTVTIVQGPGSPTTFAASGAANVAASIASFRAAIGEVDNGGFAIPRIGGFRAINWDAVKLDGTDFGGATTTIVPGKTVAIPANRFQARGVRFGVPTAVSGDALLGTNPTVGDHFPAFSVANIFAPIGTNQVTVTFVVPSNPAAITSPDAAGVSAFGVVFLDVNSALGSTVEFFSGATSVGKFDAPASPNKGVPSFIGVVFANPVITSVVITSGTAPIFTGSGTAIASGGAEILPVKDLVAIDDLIYSEPLKR